MSSQHYIQFYSNDNQILPLCSLPNEYNFDTLNKIIRKLLNTNDEYSFLFQNQEINQENFNSILESHQSSEVPIKIKYIPVLPFTVTPINRCSNTYDLHTDSILDLDSNQDGSLLASASGDTTAILWDCHNSTPKIVFTKHKNWILQVKFDLTNNYLATGGMVIDTIIIRIHTYVYGISSLNQMIVSISRAINR